MSTDGENTKKQNRTADLSKRRCVSVSFRYSLSLYIYIYILSRCCESKEDYDRYEDEGDDVVE